VGLFPEYLVFAVEAHIDERKAKFQAALKEHNIPQMQEALLAAGVSASDIPRGNRRDRCADQSRN